MIVVFNTLYILVSVVSINHLFEFLSITDSPALAVMLSIGYALGTAASIFSFTLLHRVSKTLVYSLFILLMLMEILGNVYHTYAIADPVKIKHFVELFGLTEMEVMDQKRVYAIISGLPIVLISMGYIKMLINYMFGEEEVEQTEMPKKLDSPTKQTTEQEEPELLLSSKSQNQELRDILTEDEELTDIYESLEPITNNKKIDVVK